MTSRCAGPPTSRQRPTASTRSSPRSGADRLESDGRPQRLPLRPPTAAGRVRLLQPDRAPPVGDSTLAPTGSASPRTAGLLHHRRAARPPRQQPRRRTPTSGARWRQAELISTGQGPFDSGLLAVTADGANAFFFTRETLARNDPNGNLMKLYTPASNGGFLVIPPPPDCVASDECHGPGSAAGTAPGDRDRRGHRGNSPKPKHVQEGLRQEERQVRQEEAKKKKQHKKKAGTMSKETTMSTQAKGSWASRYCGRPLPATLAGSLCRPRGMLRRRPPRAARKSNPSASPPRNREPAATPTSACRSSSNPRANPRRPKRRRQHAGRSLRQPERGHAAARSVDFALEQCPPASQAGLITVRANHDGESDNLLGTAPIFGASRPATRRRCSPSSSRPSTSRSDPGRGSHRRRLRAALHRLRADPAGARWRAADLTFWGFPADSSHDTQRFPKARREPRRGARAEATQLPRLAHRGARSVHPLINNPSSAPANR